MIPCKACLPRDRSRRYATQSGRHYRREINLFTSRIFGLGMERCTKRDIAQETLGNAKRNSGIPFQRGFKGRIRRKYSTNRIVAPHAFIDKVTIIDTLDKCTREAIVAHIARSFRYGLVNRRIGLFRRHPELVSDRALHTHVIIAEIRRQVANPRIRRSKRIRHHMRILQQMGQVEPTEIRFCRLRPRHGTYGITPILAALHLVLAHGERPDGFLHVP